ncbi:response regulator [Alsobacter sp. KACC 23698]|uniref:Response regulator n=1 Tax=Alsobacter sp. KACC 23698 TaxID=3149229 RepID=A0AAU7JDI4_9HYPH
MSGAATSKLRPRRVLVVEDEYLLAVDLARSLERFGAEVLGPVATVEEALAMIKDAKVIDGAVLDINLNGVPVYPVAEALQQRGAPFIFASGYDATAVPARFDSIPRVPKPVDTEALARRLMAFTITDASPDD